MKRSGFRPPTEEQVRRARQRKQESAARCQEKRKARPDVGMKRGKRLSPVPTTARGKARKRERFERAYHSREYMDLIHAAPCVVRGCRGWPVEAAHAGKTRKNGGRWFEVVPLCASHHREQEGRTERFNRTHGLDLLRIAAALAFEHLGFAGERVA